MAQKALGELEFNNTGKAYDYIKQSLDFLK
jgi:hypothetical protein